MRSRLDKQLVTAGLVESRSQAANLIKLGRVKVNGRLADKPSWVVAPEDELTVTDDQPILVSRAGYKLASVADDFGLDFRGKVVVDIGASTGGFTEFALNSGAELVYAVDVGTDQLHWKLRTDQRVVSLEKTDIRNVGLSRVGERAVVIEQAPDIILCDVSFISLRQVLPHVRDHLASKQTQMVVMMKPQFEATPQELNKGVIKNKTLRREIIHRFEDWLRQHRLVVVAKQDSQITGEKGNLERFYLLRKS